jgi:hypothetical protein
MARGVPLSPEQIATAAEVFEREGTYTAAAEAIGATISGTRRALVRWRESSRAKSNARALARGMREGRRSLQRVATRLERAFFEEMESHSLEPKDMAALANAIARQVETIANLDAANERRLNGRATRAKTRAEIAAIRTNAPTGDITLVVAVEGDPVEVPADEAAGGDLPVPE